MRSESFAQNLLRKKNSKKLQGQKKKFFNKSRKHSQISVHLQAY